MMKTFRVTGDEWRGTGGVRRGSRHSPLVTRHASASAFTLIEIMVVVAIMGVILTIGIPSIYQLSKKEGMRKAAEDVLEVCKNARAQAIFRGSPVEVVFHPIERRFEIGGGSASQSQDEPDFIVEKPAPHAGSGQSGQLTEDIGIGMLVVNGLNYRESEWTRVRFFPNGTSDEMRLVLTSDKGEARGMELEVTTGLVILVNDIREIQSWEIR
jgi:prepilin-type N-terminal cleavage/methylation domain-containing protein